MSEARLAAAAVSLWAKAEGTEGSRRVHPLLNHLVDVSACAELVWDRFLSRTTQRRFAECWNTSLDGARVYVALLAGLHDLGKAGPVFQGRLSDQRRLLADVGLCFPPGSLGVGANSRWPHGLITRVYLPDLLAGTFGDGVDILRSRRAYRLLADIVGGHHGFYPGAADVLDAQDGEAGGALLWSEVREFLFSRLVSELCDDRSVDLGQPLAQAEAIVLAAVTTVSDWVGSNTAFFGFTDPTLDTHSLLALSRARATAAFDSLAWYRWDPSPVLFAEQFAFTARPVQSAVEELTKECLGATLLIVEAPTGEGKTEAALHAATRLAAAGGQVGFYMGLPTQATSGQMLGRLIEFLDSSDSVDRQLQLLHGHAAFDERFEGLLAASPAGQQLVGGRGYGEDEDRPEHVPGKVLADGWFTYRNRGLLTPFGVGTVDQILLSVLPNRFFMLRLVGLTQKVVIVDEVHAYDIYMSDLLDRCLEWLAAVGTSVIVLSATLPTNRREELTASWRKGLGSDTGECLRASYPMVVKADSSGIRACPTEAARPRTVRINWCHPDGLIDLVCDAVDAGGCVALVCNTVAGAQKATQSLQHRLGLEQVTLVHARFPVRVRRSHEAMLESRFGRSSERPKRHVVVATQVIEQSLDVDFDAMFSDPAPVDLLLQRAGRLHRHVRCRPRSHGEPVLTVVNTGRTEQGTVDLGANDYIYERWVLLRTLHVLVGRDIVEVPGDVSGLVDYVYVDHDIPDGLSDADNRDWRDAKAAHDQQQAKDRDSATYRRIPPPGTGLLSLPKFTEGPLNEISDPLRLPSRLTLPSANVVPVFNIDSDYFLDPNGRQEFTLERSVYDRQGIIDVIAATIQVSSPRGYRAAMKIEAPSAWYRNAWLRDHRPLLLTRMEDDQWSVTVDGVRFRIDPDPATSLGLIIEAAS